MTTYAQRAKKIAAAEKAVQELKARIAKQKNLRDRLAVAESVLGWIRQMPVTDEPEVAVAEPEVAEATFGDAGTYGE